MNPISFKILLYSSRVVNEGALSSSLSPVDPVSSLSPLFAGFLPPCKPADLSPLERNVCWHLRRDFTILLNGDVPSCKTCLFDQINGNVFESSLEEIWQKNNSLIEDQIKNNYNKRCGKCDEYYTFNF